MQILQKSWMSATTTWSRYSRRVAIHRQRRGASRFGATNWRLSIFLKALAPCGSGFSNGMEIPFIWAKSQDGKIACIPHLILLFAKAILLITQHTAEPARPRREAFMYTRLTTDLTRFCSRLPQEKKSRGITERFLNSLWCCKLIMNRRALGETNRARDVALTNFSFHRAGSCGINPLNADQATSLQFRSPQTSWPDRRASARPRLSRPWRSTASRRLARLFLRCRGESTACRL